MEFKSGIYLRERSPCVIKVKGFYVNIKYTQWFDRRGAWVFWKEENLHKTVFKQLNEAPCRVLFYYSKKWDYGEYKNEDNKITGLMDGKDIPLAMTKLRKSFVDRQTCRNGENPTPFHRTKKPKFW